MFKPIHGENQQNSELDLYTVLQFLNQLFSVDDLIPHLILLFQFPYFLLSTI